MIDPGHPFSVPYEDLIAALEDRIRYGVEQPARAQFVFKSDVTLYELPRTVEAVTRVTGLQNGNFRVFEPFRPDPPPPRGHYRFSNNRIIWENAAERPDEGSRLEVEYTYRERPAGLTDFNPGSVIGTLVRAVAREMKLLYEQMDQAYRRAFIDQAEGVALDNVVALLGVTRRPALKAQGFATFFRKQASDTDIVIARGTRIADESGRTFATTAAVVLAPEAVEFGRQSDGTLNVRERIAELIGVWPREAQPDPATALATQDTAPDQPYGADERTITLAAGVRPDGELRIRYRPKSVRAPIEAVQPGPDGNVNAGTIVIMPTPPEGVNGVVNEDAVTGGLDPEPDVQLRERAKHALERAGNATLNALKFAVLEIEGVEGVEVIDHGVDDAIPLGEVRVRVSGGDPLRVRDVIDQTRAAGIVARLEIINPVFVSGSFYVIADPGMPATAPGIFLDMAIEHIEQHGIGEPLAVRRMNALAYQVTGLADVAEARLRTRKADLDNPGEFIEADVNDPLLIAQTELLRPDAARLEVRLLRNLAVAGVEKAGDTNRISLQLMDTNEIAVSFRSLELDLSVTIRARLLTAPDQPPERISSFTRRIVFSDAASALLEITPADTTGFRPSDHDSSNVEVTLSPAAYPGLQGVQTAIEL